MSKKKKKDELPTVCCMNCENCIYIGEGDSICDAMDEPVLVFADWEPTDDYFCCCGSDWEEQ